jgi:hypothetical protein
LKEHFVRLKVGLLEHCEDGRMTPAMMNCFTVVLGQADYATGFWKGSAAKIFAAWGGQLPLRTIQRALESLYREGYLKSFHRPGQRHNYPVAINKYFVKMGRLKGYILNASATTVPENPVYELADEENAPAPFTDSTADRATTLPVTAPNEGGVLARSQDVEVENEFREGSQSQSPDAGLHAASPRLNAPAKPKSKAKPPYRERLKASLREKIAEAGNSLSESMAPRGVLHPYLEDEQRAAFEELEYAPDLNSPLLTTHFIDAVVNVVAEYSYAEICPANLCSRVIDECEGRIKKGEPAYYPPDFVAHRDRLQKDKREAERKVTGTATMAAAAGRAYPQLPRSDR